MKTMTKEEVAEVLNTEVPVRVSSMVWNLVQSHEDLRERNIVLEEGNAMWCHQVLRLTTAKAEADEEIARLKKVVVEMQEDSGDRILAYRAALLREAVETQEAARLSAFWAAVRAGWNDLHETAGLKGAADRLLANVVEPRPE